MSATPFSKLLIANRGEIACRVIDTAHEMGYETVAVFSDADADARHVTLADEAIHLGPPPAAESYLAVEKVLDAAKRTGADAVHPGYGFLSENAGFARACEEAGIVFVGPPADAIEVMGDKAIAKARMLDADVPCVPGFLASTEAEQSTDRLVQEGEKVGFPLLVKAVAGGGGRGMRRVDAVGDLAAAIESARREAGAAFGNGAVMLERLVTGARHVEIQVFADAHGNAVHLGERDCSLQRRHQKVVEEAPSPAVDATLRERMGAAAVAAAKAIGYRGAGTVEFLVDPDGNFYFLEMNTRLQVEHPVTELVTGLDLVELQLRVAAGEPLGFEQEDVGLDGHAFEARLYAEDAHAGFIPQTGPVLAWRPTEGAFTRVDHGLLEDQEITSHYDPMVAKVISWGRDREEARRRLRRALADTVALGFVHNKRFLRDIVDHPVFIDGGVTTNFLDELDADALARPARSEAFVPVAASILMHELTPEGADLGFGGWRNSGDARRKLPLEIGDEKVECEVESRGELRWVRVGDAEPRAVRLLESDGPRLRVEVDGHRFEAHAVVTRESELHLEIDGLPERVRLHVPSGKAAAAAGSDGKIKAPSSGKVLEVSVEPGARVERGTPLLKLEAMKIESTILSPIGGVVQEVRVGSGDQVQQGTLMLLLEPDPEPES